MTADQVKMRLRKMQDGRSLAVFGKEIGVGASFLSDVYTGKRTLGKKILDYLGLVQDPPTYSEVK